MVTHKRSISARNEARTLAFRKRLEARRSANKATAPARNEARAEAFRKRLEARRAAKKAESKQDSAEARKKACNEARAKFRSKIGKKA